MPTRPSRAPRRARRPARRTVLIVASSPPLLAAIGLALLVTRSVTRPVAALGARLRSLNEHCLQASATASMPSPTAT